MLSRGELHVRQINLLAGEVRERTNELLSLRPSRRFGRGE
jgi:hypothetical protein